MAAKESIGSVLVEKADKNVTLSSSVALTDDVDINVVRRTAKRVARSMDYIDVRVRVIAKGTRLQVVLR
jgi:hypothetical protein